MRLGAFAITRLIIMLRRLWKSVDKLAEIEQSRLNLELDRMAMDYPKWHQAGGRVPDSSKKVEIGVVSVEDLNKKYKEYSFPYGYKQDR